jgi:regulation of enolase protein 1 (concanavalin A-like superfamily)
MKFITAFMTLGVAAFLSPGEAQAQTFTTDFDQSQDFTTGVGSTGWSGAYGGNNPSSTFASGGGQLTMVDTGGHWENNLNSGHLLYLDVTGDFTAECELTSLSSSAYATAGLGAFDPSITTASPTVTWMGAYYKGFDGEVGTRPVVNGSGGDDSPYNFSNPNTSFTMYFEMTRVGDVFTDYYSLTGTDFTELDSVTMSTLPETVDVGLWDGSYSGNTTTATFNSFSVESTPEPGTLALAGVGVLGMAILRRRK